LTRTFESFVAVLRMVTNQYVNGPYLSTNRQQLGFIPPNGADCKSAGLRLRWFESSPAHHFPAADQS
jgi:hypothetical protein